MIVEPIQGNGGMIMPTRTYFRDVKALLERYGVLLIADEIKLDLDVLVKCLLWSILTLYPIL